MISKLGKLFFVLIILSAYVYSQPEVCEDSSSTIKSFQIFSSSVKDTFVIDVSLPDSYRRETDRYYPVIYLTDGYWRREQHKSIHALAKTDNVKELIVVGIGYPDSYNFNEVRVRDLVKHADNFLRFILSDLVPLIEQKYRTNKERTFWGSSFGGYFGLFALFNHEQNIKRVFQNFIIASPPPYEKTFLGNESFSMFDLENKFYKQTTELPVNLYLTVGGEEQHERFLNPFKELIHVIETHNYDKLNLVWFIDPGKNHFTVWEPTLYKGLFLFQKK